MTFLFDIGRVLLDFEFGPSLQRLLPADDESRWEKVSRLMERKDEFETGSISAAEYIGWALGVLGSTAGNEDFRKAWREIFTPNEPMWRSVFALKAKGHRLILISNINTIHSPWIFDEFRDLGIFDGAVLSCDAGFIKPHPEIYQLAIARYGLVPAETPYIDDMPENVAAGRALGFPSFQYDIHDHAAFATWLADITTESIA